MSTTVYEGKLHNDIYTKEVLVNQLKNALTALKDNESTLFYFEFAGLFIELDRNVSTIYVIA